MNTGYLSLEEAIKLHGHRGPWIVLGYRLGVIARERLCPATPFSLKCTVYLSLRKPYTCILDGLQASSGCTIGKLNLEYRDSNNDEVEVVFENIETMEKLRFIIDKGSVEYINGLIEKHGSEKAADIIEGEDLWRLVKIFT
ncbi:MAG: formylmethanofuran dehydrogenase subunit E family protein [Desulfurococcaceae archaeon]